MKNTTKWAGGLMFGLAIGFAPAGAQERYGTWNDPNQTEGATGAVQEVVDELKRLVGEAEKTRSADPVFLRDLRELARRYDWPWRAELLGDDFADGDFTANPAWTVTQGRYYIEPGYGLRSVVAAPAPASPRPAQGEDRKDLATEIIGSILGQALGQKSKGQTAVRPDAPALAAIHVGVPITNAFAIRIGLTSWEKHGQIEFDLFQGGDRAAGYRLAYRPGDSGALELLAASARGTGVIDADPSPPALEDRRTHLIEWTRDAFGDMTVSVDGDARIKIADRRFRDPFDGFAVINRGGDYILSRITIHGTK
ncbi:MAG: hypothetical protein QGG17_03580 [Rhodospirillales bacterium]|jgi:hypothetical protein|nr:hypothetical protein [Rhodospirillales bacterium]MDP6803954.1 hypothetical protein [Rhodospirillales bacterium]